MFPKADPNDSISSKSCFPCTRNAYFVRRTSAKQRNQKLHHGQKLQQVSCEIVGISCSGRLPAATRPAPDHEMTPPSRPSPWSEIASKPSIPRGTSLKKSKKRRAIASVAPGPPLWPPPTRPSLGRPAQPPRRPKYIHKLPINRTSGRYVNSNFNTVLFLYWSAQPLGS